MLQFSILDFAGEVEEMGAWDQWQVLTWAVGLVNDQEASSQIPGRRSEAAGAELP